MTLEIRDLIILALIVLNIAQVFIMRGHIPPELVDKLFDFAATKAAATPDTTDDETIAELRSIANALLNAQPPTMPIPVQEVSTKPMFPDASVIISGGSAATVPDGIVIRSGTHAVYPTGTTTISSTPLPSTTTITYSSAPQDSDSPVVP